MQLDSGISKPGHACLWGSPTFAPGALGKGHWRPSGARREDLLGILVNGRGEMGGGRHAWQSGRQQNPVGTGYILTPLLFQVLEDDRS